MLKNPDLLSILVIVQTTNKEELRVMYTSILMSNLTYLVLVTMATDRKCTDITLQMRVFSDVISPLSICVALETTYNIK